VTAHCKCYNDEGKKVGYLETYVLDNPDAMGHRFMLKNGTLDVHFTKDSDLLYEQPITEEVAIAFPELAPYVDRPDAYLFTLVGDHNKDNETSLQWEATGCLVNSNYLEVRCVFLVFMVDDEPQTQKCIGCHWFIGRK
jgi:hypothetical protein